MSTHATTRDLRSLNMVLAQNDRERKSPRNCFARKIFRNTYIESKTFRIGEVKLTVLLLLLFCFQPSSFVQDLKARPTTRSQLDWICLLTTRSRNLRRFGDKKNGVLSRLFLKDSSLYSFCSRFLFLFLFLRQPFVKILKLIIIK